MPTVQLFFARSLVDLHRILPTHHALALSACGFVRKSPRVKFEPTTLNDINHQY